MQTFEMRSKSNTERIFQIKVVIENMKDNEFKNNKQN